MTICEYNTRLNEDRLPILAESRKYEIDGRKRYERPYMLAELAANTVGLKDAAEEYIYAFAFDVKMHLIALFEVGHGTVNQSLASPREIMMRLLMVGATTFALAHNHPSGDTSPSAQDVQLTDRLKQVGVLLNVPLMDHVIVGGNNEGGYGYTSLREDGVLVYERA